MGAPRERLPASLQRHPLPTNAHLARASRLSRRSQHPCPRVPEARSQGASGQRASSGAGLRACPAPSAALPWKPSCWTRSCHF